MRIILFAIAVFATACLAKIDTQRVMLTPLDDDIVQISIAGFVTNTAPAILLPDAEIRLVKNNRVGDYNYNFSVNKYIAHVAPILVNEETETHSWRIPFDHLIGKSCWLGLHNVAGVMFVSLECVSTCISIRTTILSTMFPAVTHRTMSIHTESTCGVLYIPRSDVYVRPLSKVAVSGNGVSRKNGYEFIDVQDWNVAVEAPSKLVRMFDNAGRIAVVLAVTQMSAPPTLTARREVVPVGLRPVAGAAVNVATEFGGDNGSGNAYIYVIVVAAVLLVIVISTFVLIGLKRKFP